VKPAGAPELPDRGPVDARSVRIAGDGERRTSPVELLWDLVFVFAVTQVTTLLSRDLTWPGVARSMLVLALVWWAWSAFVWALNAQREDGGAGRAVLLAATVLVFLAGLAIPDVFGSRATLFAVTYAAVRLMHLALYAYASRQGAASWRAISGFALTVSLGMALLLAGAIAGSRWQDALWTLAVAIDYAGPGLLTRARLRGLQRVSVTHFAERYGLFVLICLGESLVAVGVGASGRTLDAPRIAAAALAVTITIGMWWVYFARFAQTAEERLRAHADPVLAASDAYSYLHLLLVAGIIVFAVGVKVAIRDVGDPLPDGARLALCAGVALYLSGHAAVRARLERKLGLEELIAAAALLGLYALSATIAAWLLACAIAVVIGVVCTSGALRERATEARAVA
jgi:low temperature requirement protein LtrA